MQERSQDIQQAGSLHEKFYKKIPNPPDEVITDLDGRKYMQTTQDDFAMMTP